MPSPKKVHGKHFDLNFNLLIFVLFAFVLYANYWLTVNDIFTGVVYYTMISLTVAVIVFAMMIFSGDKLKPLAKIVRVPITTSLGLASLFFMVGFIFPIIVESILRIFTSTFSISSLSVPLFQGELVAGITQSFSAVEIAESMPWKIFNLTFNAGVVEELATFATFLASIIVMMWVVTVLFKKDENAIEKRKTIIIISAIIITSLLFMGAHVLSGNYTVPIMFLIAFLFRAISLTSIYFYGVFLIFWLGYHMSNNLIALIRLEGLIPVLNGFISWVGILYLVFFGLVIWYIITRWDGIKKGLGEWLSG